MRAVSDGFVILSGYVTVACDGCGVRRDGPVTDNRFRSTFLDDLMVHEGWTLWVSRSRRTYCPHCHPKPGHKMRQITASGGSDE